MQIEKGTFIEEVDTETGEVLLVGQMEIGLKMYDARIVPQVKRTEKTPDYQFELFANGTWHKLTSVWLQAPKKGGDDFYSFTLFHDRIQRTPLRIAVFPTKEFASEGRDKGKAIWRAVHGFDDTRGAVEPFADEINF